MPSISAHRLRSNFFPKVLHHLARFNDWIHGSRLNVKGYGHLLKVHQARLIRSKINVSGENNTLVIDSGTRLIDSVIDISGSGHVVRIGCNCILGRMTLVLQSSSCIVGIGSCTTSASVSIYLGEPALSLRVGRDCMISHRVEILCGDSHSLDDLATGVRLNPAKNIVIGDHVWLGAESAVLKGSSIGDHSTIGFRSVVTNQIPSHSLAAGIPARVIRSGVTWTRDLPWQNLQG